MSTIHISHQKHIVSISEVKKCAQCVYVLIKHLQSQLFSPFFFFSIFKYSIKHICLLSCSFFCLSFGQLWIRLIDVIKKQKRGTLLMMITVVDIGFIYWGFVYGHGPVQNLQCIPSLIRSKSLLFPTTLGCSVHSENLLTVSCWERLPEWDLSGDNWVEERPGDPA